MVNPMPPDEEMRPRCLDLFCGAGGASMGLHRAGFDVLGVDIRPQPNYPLRFMQADALTFPLEGFDFIWASPPCQRYSSITQVNGTREEHPDLIAPMRERLKDSGAAYAIENVEGAPVENPITLCGSMFRLDVRRHRLFETSWFSLDRPDCQHHRWTPQFRSLDRRIKNPSRVVGVHGHINYRGEFAIRCRAMGVDWMTNAELSQAIPPAYSEFIGRAALQALRTPA
jgi:DNA (cytosine-5)-methyltransferase 1